MKNKRTIPHSLGAPTKARYALLISRASELSGIPVSALTGSTRGKGNISLWRMVVWWVLRSEGATFQEVGDYFHRSHSAVVHGVSRIDSAKNDIKLKDIIRRIQHGDTHDQ